MPLLAEISDAAIVHGLTGGELLVPFVIESPIHPMLYGALGGAIVTAIAMADELAAKLFGVLAAKALTPPLATLVAAGVSITIPEKPVLELKPVPTIWPLSLMAEPAFITQSEGTSALRSWLPLAEFHIHPRALPFALVPDPTTWPKELMGKTEVLAFSQPAGNGIGVLPATVPMKARLEVPSARKPYPATSPELLMPKP